MWSFTGDVDPDAEAPELQKESEASESAVALSESEFTSSSDDELDGIRIAYEAAFDAQVQNLRRPIKDGTREELVSKKVSLVVNGSRVELANYFAPIPLSKLIRPRLSRPEAPQSFKLSI